MQVYNIDISYNWAWNFMLNKFRGNADIPLWSKLFNMWKHTELHTDLADQALPHPFIELSYTTFFPGPATIHFIKFWRQYQSAEFEPEFQTNYTLKTIGKRLQK